MVDIENAEYSEVTEPVTEPSAKELFTLEVNDTLTELNAKVEVITGTQNKLARCTMILNEYATDGEELELAQKLANIALAEAKQLIVDINESVK